MNLCEEHLQVETCGQRGSLCESLRHTAVSMTTFLIFFPLLSQICFIWVVVQGQKVYTKGLGE